jgi:hypothetical protein
LLVRIPQARCVHVAVVQTFYVGRDLFEEVNSALGQSGAHLLIPLR